jgi:uncharacterized membrane protein YgcG
MKRKAVIWIALLVIAGLMPAFAADGEPTTVKGEVIQLQFHNDVQLKSKGEFDHVMIQTKAGHQMRVRLGQAGSTVEGSVVEGDMVKLQLMKGGEVEVRTRTRTRTNEGTGDGTMTRTRSERSTAGTSGTSNGGGGGNRGGGGGGGR